MYAKTESVAALNGQHSTPFRLFQGVTQGDPMSCVLFNIMIDDLIETLQNEYQIDGIALRPDHENLVAQGYADNVSSLAGARAGLQRIINVYRSHLALWKGEVNINKSCTMTFHPKGREDTTHSDPGTPVTDSHWHWGDAPLPHVDKTKYLGVIFSSDCSWTAQTAYARSKGFVALAMWNSTLRNTRVSLCAKLAIIQNCIKPCITYGMEVWAPRKDDKDLLEAPLRHPRCPWRSGRQEPDTLPCGPNALRHRNSPHCIRQQGGSHTLLAARPLATYIPPTTLRTRHDHPQPPLNEARNALA